MRTGNGTPSTSSLTVAVTLRRLSHEHEGNLALRLAGFSLQTTKTLALDNTKRAPGRSVLFTEWGGTEGNTDCNTIICLGCSKKSKCFHIFSKLYVKIVWIPRTPHNSERQRTWQPKCGWTPFASWIGENSKSASWFRSASRASFPLTPTSWLRDASLKL